MGRIRADRSERPPGRARPRIVALVVLLVLAAACGGGEAPEGQDDEDRVAGVGSTSDGDAGDQDAADPADGDEPAPDDEPTDVEPSDEPDPAATEEADCSLLGRWRLRSDDFLAQLPTPAEGSVEHVEGPYDMVLEDGGSITIERDAWSLRTSTADGALRVTISDRETGTWSASGDVLTIDTTTEYSEVELALETGDGLQPIPGGTYEGADVDAMSGSGSYTCTPTQLELSVEGYVTSWDRVG